MVDKFVASQISRLIRVVTIFILFDIFGHLRLPRSLLLLLCISTTPLVTTCAAAKL